MRTYPVTEVNAVTNTVHGHKIVDNYRWLEDSDSTTVLEWSKAQNEFTEEILEQTGIGSFKAELSDLFEYDDFGLPRYKAGYYYWSERKAGTNQSAVYRKKGLSGKPVAILDPNGRREDDAIAITQWSVSPEGRYLAYCLSEGGTEMGIIYVLDLQTGKELEQDQIPYCRHPDIVWLKDESGFFYTRCPEPGAVPKADEHYYMRVHEHKLGGSFKNDPVIFGDGRHKENMYSIRLSDDRQYLVISAARGWLHNELYVHDIAAAKTTQLCKNLVGKFRLHIVRDKAYLWTKYQAEFGRVMVAPMPSLPEAFEGWQEFIPERDYKLSGISFTNQYVLAVYLKNAHSQVEVLDEAGQKQFNLELPPFASLSGMSCQPELAEFFYGFSTFLTPFEAYRYDPETQSAAFCRRVVTPIDPGNYKVSQQWYQSKDQTRVPLFVVSRADLKLNGKNPTLLYGYGGFNSSQTPGFLRGMLPFINRGGVYAVANIRGGGEFGAAWHKAGIRENKQKSFDDFIAAAEYLITKRYTRSSRLALMGASNGGLLVGACAVQRPDLFKAVVCMVPLLDMVRFPKFLIASRWISEYGDPALKNDFDNIVKWSPYHNVKSGVEYPSMLFMTADHDTRVEPLHARKMAALLQATNKANSVLIRTEIEAGHGHGKPLNKWVSGQAAVLAFLTWQLEMS